jgi:hypothetical protein
MHFYPNILTDNLKEKFIGKNKSQTWAICQKPFNIVGINAPQKVMNRERNTHMAFRCTHKKNELGRIGYSVTRD